MRIKILIAVIAYIFIVVGVSYSVENCCGLSSSGNDFTCGPHDNNPNRYGNCTWYARYRMPAVEGICTSNASNWYNQAQNGGLSTSQDPEVGSLAVFNWISNDINYGHVAYVERVNSDGSFYVSEMGWNTWNCVHYSTYTEDSLDGLIGFISSNDSSKDHDLSVSELEIGDLSGWLGRELTVDPNQEYEIRVKIRNKGNDDINDNFQVRFLQSNNNSFGENDKKLGNDQNIKELDAGDSKWEEIITTAPDKPGTYYIGAWADQEEEIEETDENNNFSNSDDEKAKLIVRDPEPVQPINPIEYEIQKHDLTQITLEPGQIIYIKTLGHLEGPKIFDGVTHLNDIYLKPHPGMPYTGTLFKIHEKGNNLYAFHCLGTGYGNKWLAADPNTLNVFLAHDSNENHHETYFAVYQDPQGRIMLRTMKEVTNPALEGYVWLDGHTQAETVHLTNNLDFSGTRLEITPLEIHWFYADPYGPPNHHCERWNEIAEPHTWWDNFLCSNVNLNMSWSFAGPLPNKRCTHIYEPADLAGTWNDNWFCVEYHNPIHFYWSSHNPVPGIRNCIKIEEPAERIWTNTWDDNWLCWEGY